MKTLFELLRVKHYIKNSLIFVPLIFGSVLTVTNIKNTILAFLAFSAMASCIYIINDIKDIDKDRAHPTKRNRVIASGKVSIPVAIVISVIMFFVSIILNYLTNSNIYSFIWLLIYFLSNIAYSFGMKNVPIIDIIFLVSFYIIRIYYGATVVEVEVSKWLLLTIMSISTFFALGKRRNELRKASNESRSVLKHYNQAFLDKFMYLSLGMTIVFYSLWAVEHVDVPFEITVPIVFIALMRYCLIIEGDSEGNPAEVIIKDVPIILLSLLYIAIVLLLII